MKNILFILSVLFITGLHAQTLDEYLKKSIENNPGLKARYSEFEAALQKIHQVKSLPDPTLSMSAFGQMIETRVGPQRAIFILNQMLPWVGTLKAQGDVMGYLAEAKFQAWLDSRNELLFKVKSAWYPIYELDQTIKYQQENKLILESFKTLSLTRFKNGKGAMVDVIRVDIMLDDLSTELIILENKRKPLLAQLNKLLNQNINTPLEITDSILPDINLPVYSIDSILENNPKLKEVEKKEQAWQQQTIVARKQGMPKLGIGLNYTIIGERTDMDVPDNGKDAIMPMVSISLPIYRKKYRAAHKEAEFMQSSLQEMKVDMSNELSATYELSYFELSKAIEEYKLFATQMEKTDQASNLLMAAYSNSGKDFEEVLRMQQLNFKYKINTSTAVKNYFIAKARLEYLNAKN
ncbi:MAG: TolC family protein [Bacteroidetes bacterium]|nr:MAG: TolC family protein [Bacteroidota bacterium]